MARLVLDLRSNVVEYTFTRVILFKAGYGAIREKDYLVVYPKRESYTMFIKKPEEQEWMGRLYVDEGIQDSCLYDKGVSFNDPAWEMCDFVSILRLLQEKFAPDHPIEPSPYLGRGYSQQHYQDEYVKALRALPEGHDFHKFFELK